MNEFNESTYLSQQAQHVAGKVLADPQACEVVCAYAAALEQNRYPSADCLQAFYRAILRTAPATVLSVYLEFGKDDARLTAFELMIGAHVMRQTEVQ